MIQFQNITKAFAQKQHEVLALDDITLTIRKGEIFGLIGHSGAGKSTLVRLINALELPTSGRVFINGHDLTRATARDIRLQKKKIGMVFQHFNLLEHRTVEENVGLPLVLNGIKKAERRRITDELLDYVGLKDKKKAYPNTLSGGQKQRVGIARALANAPDILLCDEATSALDPKTTRSILDLLKKINRERHVTVVIVTHEMSVVTYACDSVAVMSAGRVVEHGKTAALFKSPTHPVTREFVNAIIHHTLPTAVFNSLTPAETRHLYRLDMLNLAESDVALTQLIRAGNVDIRTLFANMIEVQGDIVGHLFVRIAGTAQHVANALLYLSEHDIRVVRVDPQELQHDD